MKYNVFLYPVLRAKVPIEADTPEAAIEQAEKLVAEAVQSIIADTEGSALCFGVSYVDDDESNTGEALVEDTNEPPTFSRWYECQHNGDAFPWRPKP